MKYRHLNEISKYFKPVDYVEEISSDEELENRMIQNDYRLNMENLMSTINSSSVAAIWSTIDKNKKNTPDIFVYNPYDNSRILLIFNMFISTIFNEVLYTSPREENIIELYFSNTNNFVENHKMYAPGDLEYITPTLMTSTNYFRECGISNYMFSPDFVQDPQSCNNIAGKTEISPVYLQKSIINIEFLGSSIVLTLNYYAKINTGYIARNIFDFKTHISNEDGIKILYDIIDRDFPHKYEMFAKNLISAFNRTGITYNQYKDYLNCKIKKMSVDNNDIITKMLITNNFTKYAEAEKHKFENIMSNMFIIPVQCTLNIFEDNSNNLIYTV